MSQNQEHYLQNIIIEIYLNGNQFQGAGAFELWKGKIAFEGVLIEDNLTYQMLLKTIFREILYINLVFNVHINLAIKIISN